MTPTCDGVVSLLPKREVESLLDRSMEVWLPVRMSASSEQFETILYSSRGRIATITLNRPEQLNTIVPHAGRGRTRRRVGHAEQRHLRDRPGVQGRAFARVTTSVAVSTTGIRR